MQESSIIKSKNIVNVKRKNNKSQFKRNLSLLLMSIPGLLAILVFSYLPMGGIVVAFQQVTMEGSKWVGLDNFKFLFADSDNAIRIVRNTLGLNLLFMSFDIVMSVSFAIMLNELRKKLLIKTYQTVFFFPYFVSWVVVGYMLYAILNPEQGILNGLLVQMGFAKVQWYSEPNYWPVILLISHLWKTVGYNSIIYYAGIMGIDSEYYEAAAIDGATKFQMVRNITLPLLQPIIITLVLLQIGKIFFADFGMFYFLSRDVSLLYPTTDVVDTFVFRSLRLLGNVGMSAAAGLFQSVVGFILVIVTNALVKKYNKENALF